MTRREQFIERLRELHTERDVEAAHAKADKLLIEALREFGFGDIADEFDVIEKWYA